MAKGKRIFDPIHRFIELDAGEVALLEAPLVVAVSVGVVTVGVLAARGEIPLMDIRFLLKDDVER